MLTPSPPSTSVRVYVFAEACTEWLRRLLLGLCLLGEAVMLVNVATKQTSVACTCQMYRMRDINVRSFPRVVDPDIAHGPGGDVATLENLLGQLTLLCLVLVVQNKDGEFGLLALASQLLDGCLDVLFQLPDGVLERCARVVYLIDNEDVLANQVGHLERGQVEPLCACYFCAGGFDFRVGA